MNKTLAGSLALLLFCAVSLASIRLSNAASALSINRVEWLNDVRTWRGITDPYVGPVNIAYLAGSQWMLNVYVNDLELNATFDTLDAVVYRLAVWFDWNTFYNTTIDPAVTVEYGTQDLFTISGTMENTNVASNLFTHDYAIYVEFRVSYQDAGTTVTENRTWSTTGTRFAVLSQDQLNAVQSSQTYSDFKTLINPFVTAYADSLNLLFQAEQERRAGTSSYAMGDFSGSAQHYNNGVNLLNQSWMTYTSKEATLDSIDLDKARAELDMMQAQISAVQANASAIMAQANGLANATLVNAIGFAFFGLGFIVFGIAAVVFARRPRPAPS